MASLPSRRMAGLPSRRTAGLSSWRIAGFSSTLRVSVLGAALAGALVAPGVALADGPGYGGTANALTVTWRIQIGTRAGGLAVYAVGFRAGSQVHIRVGATTERVVITDSCGALRVLVVRGPVPTQTSPTHAVPTRSVPTQAVPTRSVPAHAVPTSVVPTRPVPTSVVPTRPVPSSAVPSRAVPTRSVPTRPVPTSVVPTRSVPTRKAVSRSVVSNAFVLGSVALPKVALPKVVRLAVVQPTDTTVLTVPDESIGRLSPGTSVLVVGETPTGALRTLVGSVPPPEAGWGAQDLAPWAGAAASLGAVVFWTRRRSAVAVGIVRRYRRPARHRA